MENGRWENIHSFKVIHPFNHSANKIIIQKVTQLII